MKKLLNLEKKYKAKISTSENKTKIAVIGISLKVGRVDNYHTFWNSLKNKKNFAEEFPKSRIKEIKDFVNLWENEENINWRKRTYLPHISRFDSRFFGISPKEAILLDPQQKVLLPMFIDAIEDAGIQQNKIQNSRTGIFIGANDSNFRKFLADSKIDEINQVLTSMVPSMLTSRISYMMNLSGPAMMIDTACSSSLTAVHLAIQSLINKETDFAFAGGIKLHLYPKDTNNRWEIESSDGKTCPFDAASSGTGSGEGAGIVLLKRYDEAIRDNNPIHAVILGSAINQDGSSIGITAPNGARQTKVIQEAWNKAGVKSTDITFIETHGTGTKLGDPIEAKAIQDAFTDLKSKTNPCYISAVKANTGHLDYAAGIIGLIKGILMAKKQEILPLTNFEKLNPLIPNEKSLLNFPLTSIEVNKPIIGGVSSFGLSGTNVHIVVGSHQHSYSEKLEDFVPIRITSKDITSMINEVLTFKNYLYREKNYWKSAAIQWLQSRQQQQQQTLGFIAKTFSQCIQILNKFLQNEPSDHYYYNTKTNPSTNIKLRNETEKLIDLVLEKQTTHSSIKAIPIHLPPQRFDLQSYMPTPNGKLSSGEKYLRGNTYLQQLASSFDKEYLFRCKLDFQRKLYQQHKIGDTRVLVGTEIFVWISEIANYLFPESKYQINNLNFIRPLTIDEETILYTKLTVEDEKTKFVIKTKRENKWESHFDGEITKTSQVAARANFVFPEQYNLIQSNKNSVVQAGSLWDIEHTFDSETNTHFVRRTNVELAPLLDRILHLELKDSGFIPFSFEKISCFKKIESKCFAVKIHTKKLNGSQDFSIKIWDEQNDLCYQIDHYLLRKFEQKKIDYHAIQWEKIEVNTSIEQTNDIYFYEDDEADIITATEIVYELPPINMLEDFKEINHYLEHKVIKFLKKLPLDKKIRILIVNQGQAFNECFQIIFQSIQTEYPHLKIKWISKDSKLDYSEYWDSLFSLSFQNFRYNKDVWYTQKLVSKTPQLDNPIEWQDQTCLIVGGFGDIGIVLTDTLLKKKVTVSIFDLKNENNLSEEHQKIIKFGYENNRINILENLPQTFQEYDFIYLLSGVGDSNYLTDHTNETIQRVTSPKISLFQQIFSTPDFRGKIIATSSLNAYIGAAGNGIYGFANRYLNEIANQYKEKVSVVTLPPINDTGMAFRAGKIQEFLFHSISAKEAIRALLQASESKMNFIVGKWIITEEQLPILLDHKYIKTKTKRINDIQIISDIQVTDLEKKVGRIWAEALGYKVINVADNYYDIGGDSISGIEIIRKMKEINISVSIRDLFAHPTIQDLAKQLTINTEEINDKLEKATIQKFYDVNNQQKRLFILDQITEKNTGYNLKEVWDVHQYIDLIKLELAMRKLILRHDALRTKFQFNEGVLKQEITENISFNLDVLTIPETDNVDERIYEIGSEFIQPFNLSEAPLWRMKVVKISDERFIIFFDIHHIIADAVSLEIIKAELSGLYEDKDLLPLVYQPKDIVWNKDLNKSNYKENLDYWKKALPQDIPKHNIPTDFIRPKEQQFNGAVYTIALEKSIIEKIKKTAKELNISLFQYFLSALYLWIHKLSNDKQVILGIMTAGRSREEMQKMVGMFVNNLPLAMEIEQKISIQTLLSRTKDIAIQGFSHEEFEFDSLLEELEIDRDLSRNPLFDIIFSYMNFEHAAEKKSALPLYPYKKSVSKSSKYDLSIFGIETSDKIYFTVEYCTDLFVSETIVHFMELFKFCSENIYKNLATEIQDFQLPISTELLEKKPLQIYNESLSTLSKTFYKEDRKAIISGDHIIYYNELEDKVDQAASALQNFYKIKRNDIIAVINSRSSDNVILFLAILKIGAIYLPIDNSYPDNRVSKILLDAKPALTIGINKTELRTIKLDTIFAFEIEPFKEIQGDYSYLLYTSGSTGLPKGVLQTYNTLHNLVHWQKEQTGSERTVLQFATHTFDVSIQEIAYTLFTGGTLVLCSDSEKYQMKSIQELIYKNAIEIAILPASVLHHFASSLNYSNKMIDSLCFCLTSGEQLILTSSIRKMLKENPDLKLINQYGPTETHVVTTKLISYDEIDRPHIGTPVPNVEVYIVDSKNSQLPKGIYGEIVVSGAQVADSYIGLESTQFLTIPNIGKCYKTGDIGRWTMKNEIEFLGRKDHQVKIHGYRIELQEIDNVLLQMEGISNVFSITKEINGNSEIVTFYEATTSMDKNKISSFIAEHVPSYMIPFWFENVSELPRTKSGKIDQKSLQQFEIAIKQAKQKLQEPTTEMQNIIHKLWCNILQKKSISINDNFFLIGGQSLKAIQFISAFEQETGKRLSIRELFNHPTILGLSKIINNTTNSSFDQIKPIQEKEFYSLSNAQQRLWAVQRIEDSSITNHIPIAFEWTGIIDKNALQKAIKSIVDRHEILRTSIQLLDDKPVQKIEKNIDFEIHTISVNSYNEQFISSLTTKEFVMESAPLFHIYLLSKNTKEHLLIGVFHHIICDGWSFNIFTRELTENYNAIVGNEEIKRENLTINYKDYANWHSSKIENDIKLVSYWKKVFAKPLEPLNLPLDNDRRSDRNHEGKHLIDFITKQKYEKFQEKLKSNDLSLFQGLAAILQILLSKFSNQSDVIIGTAVAGRTHPDLDNQIGFFVNSLPLRTSIEPKISMQDFFYQSRNEIIASLDNQDFPFDKMISLAKAPKDTSRNPIFDVMIQLQNYEKNDFRIKNAKMKPFSLSTAVAKTDLNFNFEIIGEQLRFVVTYATDIFAEKRIKRFMVYFEQLLDLYCSDSSLLLDQIDIIAEEDKIKSKTNKIYVETPQILDNNIELIETLTSVWKEVLDLKDIDPYDDFYHLGGDSIKAIQLVSKLKREGFSIRVHEIFQYNTIQSMASILQPKVIVSTLDKKEVSNFSPMHYWFLDNIKFRLTFNNALMLNPKIPIGKKRLEAALYRLYSKHEMLSVKFDFANEKITKIPTKSLPLQEFYLISANWQHQQREIIDKAQLLNPEIGHLCNFILFHTPEGDRLLCIFHHLIIDSVSWRIFLQDLENSLKEFPLTSKTNSFFEWIESFEVLEQKTYLKNSEISFWKNHQIYLLPKSPDQNKSIFEDQIKRNIELTVEETKKIKEFLSENTSYSMQEYIIAAIAKAIQNYTKDEGVSIALESHGRNSHLKDLDLTETIGWFTALYPITLRSDANWLKAAQKAKNEIPHQGDFYQYIRIHELSKLTFPDIILNYHGEFSGSKNDFFKSVETYTGTSINPLNDLLCVWEFSVVLIQEKLVIELAYDKNSITSTDLDNLFNNIKENFKQLLKYSIPKNEILTMVDNFDIDIDDIFED